ncbi:MAG: MOSC domain-containing protein [Myxococcaceae bacterium]
MRPVFTAVAVEQRGLSGDRHAERRSGGKRQLLVVDARTHGELSLEPGVLKENVVIEGLDLEALPAGQRIGVGEAVIELTGPCVPCNKLEKIRPGLLEQSWGRRGQLAKVLRGGTITLGDPAALLDVNPDAEKPIRPKLP